MYPRVGIYKKITSNVNNGGAISPLIPFLKKNLKHSWLPVKENLDSLFNNVTDRIEKIFGFDIDALGLI
jgi:hypothetical protein